MTFSISVFLNNLSESALSSDTILRMAKNPIISALLITFMVFLVILLIFANAGDSLLTLATRCAFWVFLLTCGVMFLHNKILLKECADVGFAGKYEGVIGDSINYDVDRIVPVNINIDGL
jgi:L-asparagine transporter-like permease